MKLTQPVGTTVAALDTRVRAGRPWTTIALRAAIFATASALGIAAFVSPFLVPLQPAANGASAVATSPAYLGALIVLCLAALVAEAQGRAMSAKLVALLGVLVAINSALRFAETAIPGPAGFTPVFLLILLGGYVFGARFGFLLGALTMLASAILTAGIGPWLPYQMFVAGWMGMSAGMFDWRGYPLRIELGLLLLFGAAWGFLYGAIMNLWSWPILAGDPAQSWQAGLSVADGIQRYAAYYAATSLWWDAFAALGNVVLLALFGPPTLKVLRRFKQRFIFDVI
jgi:energy-coupling factor transport system substrate-specific component